jgi:hypothetical protein
MWSAWGMMMSAPRMRFGLVLSTQGTSAVLLPVLDACASLSGTIEGVRTPAMHRAAYALRVSSLPSVTQR